MISRRDFVKLPTIALAGLTSPSVSAEPVQFRPPETPELYTDDLGLIVQKDGDGGDTAQREGWAWFGIWIRKYRLNNEWSIMPPISFERTIELLEVGKTGDFVRNPKEKKWWSDPKKFSRDQQVPLIAAMGAWKSINFSLMEPLKGMKSALRECPYLPEELEEKIREQLKNLPQYDLLGELKDFHWTCVQGTKDLASPAHINLFKRALGESPLLQIGDIQLFIDVLVRLAAAANKPDDVGDDLNLIVNLLMAELFSPTPASKLALELYRKNRPVCSGCFLGHYREAFRGNYDADEVTMVTKINEGRKQQGWTPDCPRVLGALRWYFRPEPPSNANPELAELYKPIVESFLS
jgi:hypothetical protein